MVRYLCLDDEENLIRPYIRQIKKADSEIEINIEHPQSFDNQITDIIEQFKTSYDGLILDLRLDEKVKNGQRANFRAPAFAQELRSRANDEDLSYPIVLWSTEEKLSSSYYKDFTAQDLFDLVCSKNDIIKSSPTIANQLISLVEGYKRIKKRLNTAGNSVSSEENLRILLGLKKAQIFVDPRILGYFDGTLEKDSHAIYKYAKFVMKDLIETQGPLIDEQILAARLGIDMVNSADWGRLKSDFLHSSEFTGVFGKGWKRWWGYLVEDWWRTKIKAKNLRELSATARVQVIREVTQLSEISPANPIDLNYSDTFWTICQVYKTPLSPLNGLILKQPKKQPWQEYLYVSEKAFKANKLGHLEIDPLEKKRL